MYKSLDFLARHVYTRVVTALFFSICLLVYFECARYLSIQVNHLSMNIQLRCGPGPSSHLAPAYVLLSFAHVCLFVMVL